jgi:integrase
MIERTKANKAGDCTVYVEVSVSIKGEKKRTVRIPTNIKVNATHWSAKSQSVIRGKSKDYYKINQMLISQKEVVHEIIAELQQKGRFELAEIKRKYIQKTSPVIYTFFQQFDDVISRKEGNMSYNGIKDYKTLKSHLTAFEKHRKEKIILSDVDSSFFEEFESFLALPKPKEDDEDEKIVLADSTILKNLQTLRTYLNGLHDQGMPVNPNYKKYRVKQKPEPPLVTLEEEEYKILLNKVDNERLEKVRKLFVLQCSTGLRYSDAIKIRKNHVRNETIYLNSTKTRQKLQIPLNKNSKQILESCNYNTSAIAISNQKYNDYIKELCENIGIDGEIMKITYRGNKEVEVPMRKYEIMSSHHGRRFFITQNLINGIRPEVIMSMTGHVDFRSFKKYIAITDTVRVNAMTVWSNTFG